MISTHAFLMAQLELSLDLISKKLKSLEKNCLDTNFDIVGRCLIAYFLTLKLVSYPSDKIYNPINC